VFSLCPSGSPRCDATCAHGWGKLYEKPDAASKVVKTAGKGLVLHASEKLTDTDNNAWYSIEENDGTGIGMYT